MEKTAVIMPAMHERSPTPSMAASRPAPFFLGDDLALDFLNTRAAPSGETVEWLASGLDLVHWLEAARSLPPQVAAEFRRDARIRSLAPVVAEARDLREWFRGFVEAHVGTRLERGALRDLARLNQLLGRDDAYRQIELAPSPKGEDHDHRALRWGNRRRWRNARMLLLPIAEAMGDLVCGKDFSLVRRCEGLNCTLWFLDTSKAHGRRWCSMALCGNRAKAAAHRARLRNAAKPPVTA
jgi:predicted RNA-binding Zn ribbon-like protein